SLLAGAASAQTPDPAHLSLVAGYKAAFTCSAHFNAGRSVEQIADDELNRIYRDYREAMAVLPDAVIDEKAKTVSVSYDGGERIAAWRPYLGCVQLPTLASADAVKDMPAISLRQDKKATPPLDERLSNDPGLLNIVRAAFDRATYGEGTETTAVLVLKDGAIVAEQYREGFDATTPQRTWSVAKSIAGTVIGAAVKDGILKVKEPAGLAAWSSPADPRGKITLENLLHMSSGLTSGAAGNRTDDVYFGGGRVIDHAATNRLVAEPGTQWRYANNDTMLAMRVLHERMNDDRKFLEYPFVKVLGPLGMDHTFLETDWNGDFIMSSQVWTTARDLARLGLLYLNDGVWEGKRILPEGWAAYVATPAPAQP
ncbi:MAG: serine hydrolase, partial [Oricola sp.]|nr:serine hydrolase [Oricola sp.]